ncbi:hypothetical protein QN219_13825 [Sinorhizobium sp. 7-81]|nr:hypothetical protein [Sinorhizobium sp. 8-89]MDK1491140.1 hypothetical protein [Sinorhizobium sp. 8-89]
MLFQMHPALVVQAIPGKARNGFRPELPQFKKPDHCFDETVI